MEITDTEGAEGLVSEERPGLKEVEYDDFIGRKGKVVYERRGNRVIFSAVRSSREATSTVNAAEIVVVAISEAEGIDWRDPEFGNKFEFYDLSTPVGYPSRKNSPFRELMGLGDVEIDRLNINPDPATNYIHVDSWTPVNLGERRDLLEPPKEPNPNQ